MDQLYEALPIPLSGDEGDVLEGGSNLDLSAHSSGISSRSCSSSLSADATNSVLSSALEETSTDVPDTSSNHLHAVHHLRRQWNDAHAKGFTTSSPPNEVYMYLMQLMRTAEDLHIRLERFLSGKVRSMERDPDSSEISCVRDNVSKNCIRSGAPRAGRNGSSLMRCHGAAKLRSRLRKEMDKMRRAVEGLEAVGYPCALPSTSLDSCGVPPSILEAAVACVQCNSLHYFGAIVTCLEHERDVTGVLVPVGGGVGPRSCVRGPSVEGPSVTHKPPFTDNTRIEVDVVSCNEHRWIKVKTTTARNLELEAAALEVNGATPFTDMLLALIERSKQICLPHRRAVQVAVVLLHFPPSVLRKFFAAHGVLWTSLSDDDTSVVPRSRTRVQQFRGTLTSYAASWLPVLVRPPEVICLDTTALITFCSQSCYVDGLPHHVRMERLAPFHVLQEQQRKEEEDCHAVVEVLEPALRLYTAWYTRDMLEQMMRNALMSPSEDAISGTTQGSNDGKRSEFIPEALLVPTELDWLGPLEKAARERLSDGAVSSGLQSPGITTRSTSAPAAAVLDESKLLVDYSGCVDGEAEDRSVLPSSLRRPNWIMADVTYEEFKWILETIAGPQEVGRAARLLRLVSVVDTTFLRSFMGSEVACDSHSAPRGTSGRGMTPSHTTSSQPSPALFTSVEYLQPSGKVSLRNKVVFGLADAVNAVLVTSNEQLCHAAREQGVHLEACLHPSRSLTEQKIYGLQRRQGPGKPPAVTP